MAGLKINLARSHLAVRNLRAQADSAKIAKWSQVVDKHQFKVNLRQPMTSLRKIAFPPRIQRARKLKMTRKRSPTIRINCQVKAMMTKALRTMMTRSAR